MTNTVSLGGYRVPILVRPLVVWSGAETEKRRSSPFRAKFSDTSSQFGYEMFKLQASNIVLEMFVLERQIRNDGWIREDARPSKPGVVLSFQSDKIGAVRFPCDTFTDWQDNFRAIVLSLEALRRVDRYGVTKRSEQFAGWKSLPATTNATLSSQQAAAVIESFCNSSASEILASARHARNSIRVARGRTHPDRNSGSDTQWKEVQEAASVLVAYFGEDL